MRSNNRGRSAELAAALTSGLSLSLPSSTRNPCGVQQHERERERANAERWAALDLRDRVEGQEPAYTRRYRDEWDHLIPWKAADTTPSASVFEWYSQQTFRGLLEVYGLELVRPEWGHAPGSIVEARDAAWA